ncbi:hypothetical protein JOH50_004733 [Rhizobium leguminosarum]|nr:hypothetical protein [Rhizobium leguminosarum]
MNGSQNRDEFIVYCHEIISGSDVGLHFAATLEAAHSNARIYRDAFRTLDPTGEPLGVLAVYEMVLRMPDVATMIDLLNSPDSLLKSCLTSRKRVAVTVD